MRILVKQFRAFREELLSRLEVCEPEAPKADCGWIFMTRLHSESNL